MGRLQFKTGSKFQMNDCGKTARDGGYREPPRFVLHSGYEGVNVVGHLDEGSIDPGPSTMAVFKSIASPRRP